MSGLENILMAPLESGYSRLSHNIRSTDISLALRQLAFAFKLSDMVKQQLDDVFLDALASAQGGGSLQFVHEIRGYIS